MQNDAAYEVDLRELVADLDNERVGETAFGEIVSAEASAPRQQDRSRGGPDYIRWVQASLNRVLQINLAVDGIAGPQTRSAIRAFQQQRALKADGIVGPATEAALIAAGATRPRGAKAAAAPPGCPPQAVNVDPDYPLPLSGDDTR